MPTHPGDLPPHSEDAPRTLPERPNLRHLKDQAKDLLKAGGAASLTDAQFKIARLYGFVSWPKLKAHVDSLEEIGQLKLAIDTNDFEKIKTLMTRNPALHRAPLGYNKNGPLTWVAECRVPWERPGATRLAIAKWMIENGSDVHQGGDGPLMRATLGDRIPMMELLVSYGADVNAEWNGYYPIIFGACEAVDAASLKMASRARRESELRPARQEVFGYRARSSHRLLLAYAGARQVYRHPSRSGWGYKVRSPQRPRTASRAAGSFGEAVGRGSGAAASTISGARLRRYRHAPPHAAGSDAAACCGGVLQCGSGHAPAGARRGCECARGEG
jgi:hypothetical protein